MFNKFGLILIYFMLHLKKNVQLWVRIFFFLSDLCSLVSTLDRYLWKSVLSGSLTAIFIFHTWNGRDFSSFMLDILDGIIKKTCTSLEKVQKKFSRSLHLCLKIMLQQVNDIFRTQADILNPCPIKTYRVKWKWQASKFIWPFLVL